MHRINLSSGHFCGVARSSGLVHRICVLMAESSECGFESWLQPWCLCPWARHITIIASLHPGVNGYLWGQSWLLCLISPMRRNGSNWAVYSPRELRWFQEWFMCLMSWGNNVQRLHLVARICALYKNHALLLLFIFSGFQILPKLVSRITQYRICTHYYNEFNTCYKCTCHKHMSNQQILHTLISTSQGNTSHHGLMLLPAQCFCTKKLFSKKWHYPF